MMRLVLLVVLPLAAMILSYKVGFSDGFDRGKRAGIDATISEVERQVTGR